MADACIFCKIVAGTAPCYPVYDDDVALAFMDHRPLNTGHVLVIPKSHEPDFHRLDDDDYGHLMRIAKRLAQCLERLYYPPKVGLFLVGFHVPHVHVHVVPLYAMQDLTLEALERAMQTPPVQELLVHSWQRLREALARSLLA